MIHTSIYFDSEKTSGYNFEYFYYELFRTNVFPIINSYGISKFQLNPNFNLLGNGWLNKDIPTSNWVRDPNLHSSKLIFKFKFGCLRIFGIPLVAPGAVGNRKNILGHFKIIGYQVDDKINSMYNVIHESASIYTLLARSLIFDTYLISAMNEVKFMNFIENPSDIDLTEYVFVIHCPILNEFKLFAHLHTYRLNWYDSDLPTLLFNNIYTMYDYNLHKPSEMGIISGDIQPIKMSINNQNYRFPLLDYNADIVEDDLYTELAEILRPGVKNIYDVNFIEEPYKLRVKIEEKFKRINYELKRKDINLISSEIRSNTKEGMFLNCILNDFSFLFDVKQATVRQFGPVNDKYVDILNSVEAWNFNFAMPIYFYYGELLAEHLLGGIRYLESVIGPYIFLLNDHFRHILSTAFTNWPWDMSNLKSEDMFISMFQVYFLLLMLVSDNGKVIVNNLADYEINRLTLKENEIKLQNKLAHLFNAQLSKSTIMDDIYVLDDLVVFDPIVNKIIKLSTSKSKLDVDKLSLLDAIYVIHNLKLYSIRFRKFLATLTDYDKIDNYIKENNG